MKAINILIMSALFIAVTACGGDDDDEVKPLDIDMAAELPGYWETTYLHADLVASIPPLNVSVEIKNENVNGGVTFFFDENDNQKAKFDVFTDMTITASLGNFKLHEESEDQVPIDNRLSWEIIDNNYFRFYVNDSSDRPIEMFDYIAFDDLTFFAVEKTDEYLDLQAQVNVMNNFGDLASEVPELPAGDIPTTGTIYIRLQKVADQ